MHWLTRISLYKRWLTLLIVAVIIGGGIYATFHLQQEMIPDIELPMTTVITIYPGASPDVVVDQITKPIEEAIARVGGQKQIRSTSTDASGVGMSVVMVSMSTAPIWGRSMTRSRRNSAS